MTYARTAARAVTTMIVAAISTTPLMAQTDTSGTDIDALIDTSATNTGAIAAARSQMAAGDLLGAAATLERALLARPGTESDPVRLQYAALLCQLGDPRRASYQLGNVTDPAAAGWDEARAACPGVTVAPPAPRRQNGVVGSLAAGVAYDGDAYGALATQLDLPTVPSLAEDGFAVVTAAQLDARFGTAAKGYGYAGASFVSKDSIDGPQLDYQVGGLRLGYAAAIGDRAELAFGGVVRHARLLNDPFVTEYGGQVSLGIEAGTAGRWSIDAEVVGQDYKGGAIPSLRDGERYDLALSYRRASAPGSSWTVGVAAEAKDADLRTLGYRGGRAFAATQRPIAASGTYLNLSGTVRRVDYRNPTVGADLKEWRLFGRAAIGVPLGASGLFVEPAVSYTARLYNNVSLLRDYDSFGAELRLVYQF